MLRDIDSRKSLRVVFITMLIGALAFWACSSGGGETNEPGDNAGSGTQFAADGGAGATLTISVSSTVASGGTTGFTVTATDAEGRPLAFIRIFCDTEQGLAIIEPSEGGVAFEFTSAGGVMSGLLGGLAPGSYSLRCEGNEGTGLVAQTQIVVTGTPPEGFDGFPGAAGGNLGGGRIVDQRPTGSGDGGLSIVAIEFDDAGSGSLGSGGELGLDIAQNCCETPGSSSTSTSSASSSGTSSTFALEPFTITAFSVTIDNDTLQRFTAGTVSFTIADGRPATTGTFSITTEVGPQSEASIIGVFMDAEPSITFAGTSTSPIAGTFTVTATVTGTLEDGTTETFSASTGLAFDDFNNCPSGTTIAPLSSC